jgi:hypothetical protein
MELIQEAHRGRNALDARCSVAAVWCRLCCKSLFGPLNKIFPGYIRKAYEDFAQGNIPVVFAAIDASITWHVPGHNPLSGDYSGHDQIGGFFQRTIELSGGEFRIDVHNVLFEGSCCRPGHGECNTKRAFRVISGGPRLANEGWKGDRIPRVSGR